jgi:hypothetical protein
MTRDGGQGGDTLLGPRPRAQLGAGMDRYLGADERANSSGAGAQAPGASRLRRIEYRK